MTDAAKLYPCYKCGKVRTKAEGGTVFTVCDSCWDKHYPKEAMTMTKDEIIAEMLQAEKRTMATDRELAGFSEGCRKMYDHRQKEIDVLKADLALEKAMNRSHVVALETSAPFQLGAAEANRWWAERWMVLSGMDFNFCRGVTSEKIAQELTAAAARVMEK